MTIENSKGIHARPASVLVKLAQRYDAEVTLEKDGVKVSAKSIMGVLTLQAPYGTVLKVTADGPDAEQVMDELEALIKNKFNEES
jgi:phosphocarrier protein